MGDHTATVVTLGQLMAGLGDDPVVTRLTELYHLDNGLGPATESGYRGALATLRAMEPVASDCELALQTVVEGDESWVDVSGVEDGARWAIEFEPWARWLGMAVTAATLNGFKPLDIVAHALWEMTWSGFDEVAIQAKASLLASAVESWERLRFWKSGVDSGEPLG